MKRALLFLSASLLILISCEKDVEVEMPDYTPVLVVNSFFEADSFPRLEVLFSRSINDTTSIKKLKTSEVDVYENDQYIGRMLNDTTGNFSLAGFKPDAGKQYKVIVKQTGFKDIEAVTTCPVPTPVSSFSITKGAGTGFNNEPLARLSVTFNDPGSENYYFLRMTGSRVDTFYIDSVNYSVYESIYDIYLYPASTENAGENFVNGGYLTNDSYFNGRNYTVNVNFDQFLAEDTASDIHLYFSTVSKEYYDYFRTLNLQQMTGFNPFSEPVRVYSNITNGLGILGGVTTQRYKVR